MFFIELPSQTPRTDEFRKKCGKLAMNFKQPEFVPNEDKAKSIQNAIEKADKDKQVEGEEEKVEEQEPEEAEEKIDLNDLEK